MHQRHCPEACHLTTAGVLVATSLGAFGPLFSSDYVYNATALADALTSLGVTFPNNQLQRGEQQLTLIRHTSFDKQLELG